MNIVDICVIVIIAGSIMLGYYRGFVSQLVSAAGVFAAYLAAYFWFDDAAPLIRQMFSLAAYEPLIAVEGFMQGLNLEHYLYNAISFAAIFFAAKVGLSVVGRVLNLVAKTPGIHTVNKWCGALLALAEALIVIVIAVKVMQIWPHDNARLWTSESKAAQIVNDRLPSITEKLEQLWAKDEGSQNR